MGVIAGTSVKMLTIDWVYHNIAVIDFPFSFFATLIYTNFCADKLPGNFAQNLDFRRFVRNYAKLRKSLYLISNFCADEVRENLST